MGGGEVSVFGPSYGRNTGGVCGACGVVGGLCDGDRNPPRFSERGVRGESGMIRDDRCELGLGLALGVAVPPRSLVRADPPRNRFTSPTHSSIAFCASPASPSSSLQALTSSQWVDRGKESVLPPSIAFPTFLPSLIYIPRVHAKVREFIVPCPLSIT